MIFLYINTGIAVFNVLMWWLTGTKAMNMFRKRYPEMKTYPSHWSERAINFIKGALFSICPICNVFLAWIWLTKNDEICEEAVAEIYHVSKEAEFENLKAAVTTFMKSEEANK